MGTPAPHTPINFVKGGASMAWSAECVAALMECGYHPDDFGDYKHVRKRCAQAAARVQQHKDSLKEPPEAKPPDPPLTPHDYFLADCQAGHLKQDATQREAGSRATGSACDRKVDGADSFAAPCMPHHGRAQDFGTQHNLVSTRESEQAFEGTPPPEAGDPYDREKLEADTKKRTQEALEHRVNARKKGATPESAPYATSGQPAYFGPNAPPDSVADPKAAEKRDVIAPEADPRGRPASEVAAECIDAFRKKAEEALMKPWLPAQEGETEEQAFQRYRDGLVAEREKYTSDPSILADAEREQQSAEQALAEIDERLTAVNARSRTHGYNGELQKAHDAASKAKRRGATELHDKHTQRVQQLQAERDQLKADRVKVRDRLDGSQETAERIRGIDCLIAEADRLKANTPKNEPVVPNINPFLGRDPKTEQAVAKRIRDDVAARRKSGTTRRGAV